ncbi:MAG: primosomal protein N' [Bacillota bacterium]|nr:primosomal protein N' [Bacillota bacterium]
MYAQVIVSNTSHSVDRPFHYIIPPSMLDSVKIGVRVAVTFGQGDRLVEGYVVEVSDECPKEVGRLKEIIRVIDSIPMFSEELIRLGSWMRKEYLCTWAEALHCIMPAQARKKGVKYVILKCKPPETHPGKSICEWIAESGGRLEYEQAKDMARSMHMGTELDDLIEKGYLELSYSLESKVSEKHEKWAGIIPGNGDIVLPKNAFRMKAVVDCLLAVPEKELPCGHIMRMTGCGAGTLAALERKGIITLFDRRSERTPELQVGLIEDRVEQLSHQQKAALKQIRSLYGSGVKEVLLHGVTGSGKTEVYMNLIGDTMQKGKKAIVLVPEISLTPQMVEWYAKRFGNRAAVFHSKLSPGERYDQWEGIRRGEYDVAIGARSAVFAPFEDIGLIILDEEHEHTYKSESSPRYVARDVARQRVFYYGGLLVLGSATPSVETYYRAAEGSIGLVELTERVGGSTLPVVETVDMRTELKEGNRSIFSRKLKEEIENALSGKHQIILLLNRRGYFTYVSCRDCGNVVKCRNCDISLTYHKNKNVLLCHYCGFTGALPDICPSCGSKRIKYMGSGTEKLEAEVVENFPDARVLRMDVDSTRRKGSHYNILKAFKNKEGDILLGTQMIAKGLDFPGVSLVGVILADFTLNLPDFRSAERAFQILTQVSGRAGRSTVPGKVIVQTYSPEHYSIITSSRHDFKEFYRNEIEIRRRFGYPPFSRLLNIVVTGAKQRDVAESCKYFYNDLTGRLENIKDSSFEVFGPGPALHSRIQGKYRWQIIIKSSEMEIIKEKVKESWLDAAHSIKKDVNIIIDVDPYSLM